MRSASFVLVACACILGPAKAQAPGTCDRGSAIGFIETPDLKARFFNTGSLFYREGMPDLGYEVPRWAGKSSLYAASLILGGTVNGDLRVAGSRWDGYHYWPGPLNADGSLPSRTDCSGWDRIFAVSQADVAAFADRGVMFPDLRDWPVGLGAPAVDGSGLPIAVTSREQRLDLGAGERPVIYGGPTAFWVMNDVGNTHSHGGTAPIGVEVRVSAFANYLGTTAQRQTTVVRFEVVNRNAVPIDSLGVGFFVDPDLGDGSDDYIASDTTRSMIVTYNADDNDEAPWGYGIPPALGVDVLSGASASAVIIDDIGGAGFPYTPLNFYNRLSGLWSDGTPIREGGYGVFQSDTAPVTRFSYPGDPLTGAFWSEQQPFVGGVQNRSGDRFFTVAAPRQTLAPGASRIVDLAIVFAQGSDRFDSITQLRLASDEIQSRYEDGSLFSGAYQPAPAIPAEPQLLVPASDADLNTTRPDSVTFSWTSEFGADEYALQVSGSPGFDSLLVSRRVQNARITLPARALAHRLGEWTYWRVAARNFGGASPWAAPRRFHYPLREFVSFEVVSNAGGAVVPAQPGAAEYAGFPTPGDGRPETGVQQSTSENLWFISNGLGGTNYSDWLRLVLPGNNTAEAFPYDYEIRFNGPTSGLDYSTRDVLSLPFEIWRTGIGTPDDQADDVRLVPLIIDDDQSGGFGLRSRSPGEFDDSTVSGGLNDPFTDRIFFYKPVDMSPGDAGYNASIASEQVGNELLAGIALVSWNGLERATIDTLPEEGTVFRMVSDHSPVIVGSEDGMPSPAGMHLAVYPNPLRNAATVSLSIDKPFAVRLTVVDVLGRTVVELLGGELPVGDSQLLLDTSQFAAGVYAVVLDVDGRRMARTITVAR